MFYTSPYSPNRFGVTEKFPTVEGPVTAELILHMDGADASTTFTDDSTNSHTVTPASDAQIDTAQSKFGGAAGLFDGVDDYLSIPGSSSWDIIANSSNDWTISLFVKHVDHVGYETYVSQRTGGDQWQFVHHDTEGIYLMYTHRQRNGFLQLKAEK